MTAELHYRTSAPFRPDVDVAAIEETTILRALNILEERLKRRGISEEAPKFTCSHDSKQYLMLHLSQLEIERFDVLFVAPDNRLIEHVPMSYGTVDSAPVKVMEIARLALRYKATGVILAHNHPTGCPLPSKEDDKVTRLVRDALELIGVRLLDHIVVGGAHTYSYGEAGRMPHAKKRA